MKSQDFECVCVGHLLVNFKRYFKQKITVCIGAKMLYDTQTTKPFLEPPINTFFLHHFTYFRGIEEKCRIKNIRGCYYDRGNIVVNLGC